MNDPELRKLNFQELITLGVPDVDAYTFDRYRENGYEHRPINGYCVSCEKQGFNISPEDESYRLANISHGAWSSAGSTTRMGGSRGSALTTRSA